MNEAVAGSNPVDADKKAKTAATDESKWLNPLHFGEQGPSEPRKGDDVTRFRT